VEVVVEERDALLAAAQTSWAPAAEQSIASTAATAGGGRPQMGGRQMKDAAHQDVAILTDCG